MLNYFRFFSRKSAIFRINPLSHFFYNNIGAKQYSNSFLFIDKELKELNLSLEQINNFLIKNIENNKFLEFWKTEKNSEKFEKIFAEIDDINKNLWEDLSVNHEKHKLFSKLTNEIKSEELFNVIFNRILTIIHKYNMKYNKKELSYEVQIKILSMMINFLSILIYLNQNLSKKNLDFISKFLSKLYSNGQINFDFNEKNKIIHDLLKENMLLFLNDNLIVYQIHHFNFLNQFPYNFGNMISQINEYLLDFDEKIRLSRILISYLQENLLEYPEILELNEFSDEKLPDLFNLCFKDKSDLSENSENLKYDSSLYKVKFSSYFLHTFKQINDYFVYIMNEKKPIDSKNVFITMVEVLKLHGTELNLRSVLYYLQKFCNEESKTNKKNYLSKEIDSKLSFVVDCLQNVSSGFKKTFERNEEIISFFENSFKVIFELVKSPVFDSKLSSEKLARIFQIFTESRIISLNLLSLIEEKLMNSLDSLNFHEFFKILLFYTQSPYGISPSSIKYQILYYIKLNFRFFNFESLLSIGIAILQIGYNKTNKLFEVFMFVDPEIWSKLIEKIMNNQRSEMTKAQIFKIYMFVKLINLDPTLKNEYFEKIAKDYEKDFLAFEFRTISEIQRNFEKMLDSYRVPYVMEPPLINGIFSIDFLINIKKEEIIVEINGPHHYFTLLWEKNDLNENILTILESKSENFDEKKGVSLTESRYTTLKQEFLQNLGYTVLNISYLNMKNYENKEKLFNYFMDYVELKNKKKIKEHYF